MRLGRFELTALLSAGRTASTYLGSAPDGSSAAVSVPHDTFQVDREIRAALTAAVEAARRVRAPWVLGVVDAGVENDRMWWATEYVAGPTLDEHVRSRGPLPESMLVAVAARMADALAGIEATGGSHGSLTGASIILAGDGPYLTDIVAAITTTGGDGRQRPSDVFSLADVLLFAASGRSLVDITGDSSSIPDRTIVLQFVREHLPPPLHEPIALCLAPDPSDRPSARALASMLTPGAVTLTTSNDPTTPAGDLGSVSGHPSATRRRPTRKQITIVLACVAVACVLGVFIVAPSRAPSSPAPTTARASLLPPDGPGAEEVRVIRSMNKYADWIAVSPDGATIYANAEKPYPVAIDAAEGTLLGKIDVLISSDTALAVSPDSKLLYTVQEGFRTANQLLVIDAKTYRQVDAMDVPNVGNDVAVSSDGRRAYIAFNNSKSNGVDVVDLADRKVIASIPFDVSPTCHMTFSPDGRYLYVPGSENAVIDTTTTTKVGVTAEPPPPGRRFPVVGSTAFSADGSVGFQHRQERIVMMDGRVMGDMQTFVPELEGALPAGARTTICAVAASRSGRHLFLAVRDQNSLGDVADSAIAVFDTVMLRLVDSIELSGVVDDMVSSPDGRTLYAPADDVHGIVMVVDVSRFE